ncbi:MAG: tetratricopeptide repeat protein [Desulfobulbus sp.]|nr:tetratricopeptide repeat protein [Desulfobulbus sp.]
MPTDQSPPPAVVINQTFVMACQAHSEGRLQEALEAYLELIVHVPVSALLRYNLGLVYYELERFVEALRSFTLANSLIPDDIDTLFNLALCHRKNGDSAAAIANYEQVLVLAPNHVDSLYNLGGCYQHLHQDHAAGDYYRQVLALVPDYLSALNNLAYLHHRAGETQEAIALYARVLELRPEDEPVRYLLAALLGAPLEQAPDDYVRAFFDTYAEDFERSLVEDLGYDNPRRLFECLCHTKAISAASYAHGLDLGCGTGLSGLAFKERVTVLDGVDLSAAMLHQAADKGCYHCLSQDSIDHFLHSTDEHYDFFLATDVFIYVGALESIFTMAHEHARPGALFCFSTEYLADEGFRLLPTGRFAYSSTYIQQLASSTGWNILSEEPTRLRRERDAWISGELWIFQWQKMLSI